MDVYVRLYLSGFHYRISPSSPPATTSKLTTTRSEWAQSHTGIIDTGAFIVVLVTAALLVEPVKTLFSAVVHLCHYFTTKKKLTSAIRDLKRCSGRLQRVQTVFGRLEAKHEALDCYLDAKKKVDALKLFWVDQVT